MRGTTDKTDRKPHAESHLEVFLELYVCSKLPVGDAEVDKASYQLQSLGTCEYKECPCHCVNVLQTVCQCDSKTKVFSWIETVASVTFGHA